MFRSFPLFVVLQLTPLLGGCVVHIGSCSGFSGIEGSGVSRTEARQVADFRRIRVEGSADVIAKVGGGTALRVTADDNLLQYVVTEVRDGTLVVDLKPGSYSFRSDLKVEVSTPALEGVAIDGSADVVVEGLSGPGFSVEISGSGDVRATGAVDQLRVAVDGSGNFHLFGLEAKDASVSISGSGDAQVFVTGSLSASISGSGDVRYRGNPSLKSVKVGGSGSIERD